MNSVLGGQNSLVNHVRGQYSLENNVRGDISKGGHTTLAMTPVRVDHNFSSEKARVLSKVDLSRKGSVDEPVAELVGYINSLDQFYMTSSCSGRLAVLQEAS